MILPETNGVMLETKYAGRTVEVPWDLIWRQQSEVERLILRRFFDVVNHDDVDWGFG